MHTWVTSILCYCNNTARNMGVFIWFLNSSLSLWADELKQILSRNWGPPKIRKNSAEMWLSMTRWFHLLNLRYTHGCFHMCIYLKYFIIKQKGRKENFKDQCNEKCSAQTLGSWKTSLGPASCSVAFLEEDVDIGLFSSAMSQTAKQEWFHQSWA